MAAAFLARRLAHRVIWYFNRGWLSLLTVPLFLFLLAGAIDCIVGGVEMLIALLRASDAVLGFPGLLLASLFGWILLLLPSFFYYSLLRNIPLVWLKRDVILSSGWRLALTIGMLVLFVGIGDGIYFADYHLVGWIADLNPCAAFKAGVIGSIPPPPDCH